MRACEANGAQRLINKIIPDYKKYLSKLHDPEQQEGPEHIAQQQQKFLEKLTVPMIQGYLLSAGCDFRKNKDLRNKKGLVKYFQEKDYKISSLCTHLIAHDIDCNDDAKRYLADLIAAQNEAAAAGEESDSESEGEELDEGFEDEVP